MLCNNEAGRQEGLAVWRWAWIAGLILLGLVAGPAAWVGWLILLIPIGLLLPPLWDRIEANGFNTRARGRTFSAGAISLLLLLAAWGGLQGRAAHADAKRTIAEGDALLSQLTVPEKDRHWRYATDADQMRGTKWWGASLYAGDKALLGFPYAGGTPARIVLGQSSNEGPFDERPMLILENGQIDCYGCRISFKFDDGPILESIGSKTDCGEAQCVILNAYKEGTYTPDTLDFTQHLLKAHKLTIEVPIYQHGNHQYTFDLTGLEWPRPGAPRAAADARRGG